VSCCSRPVVIVMAAAVVVGRLDAGNQGTVECGWWSILSDRKGRPKYCGCGCHTVNVCLLLRCSSSLWWRGLVVDVFPPLSAYLSPFLLMMRARSILYIKRDHFTALQQPILYERNPCNSVM